MVSPWSDGAKITCRKTDGKCSLELDRIHGGAFGPDGLYYYDGIYVKTGRFFKNKELAPTHLIAGNSSQKKNDSSTYSSSSDSGFLPAESNENFYYDTKGRYVSTPLECPFDLSCSNGVIGPDGKFYPQGSYSPTGLFFPQGKLNSLKVGENKDVVSPLGTTHSKGFYDADGVFYKRPGAKLKGKDINLEGVIGPNGSYYCNGELDKYGVWYPLGLEYCLRISGATGAFGPDGLYYVEGAYAADGSFYANACAPNGELASDLSKSIVKKISDPLGLVDPSSKHSFSPLGRFRVNGNKIRNINNNVTCPYGIKYPEGGYGPDGRFYPIFNYCSVRFEDYKEGITHNGKWFPDGKFNKEGYFCPDGDKGEATYSKVSAVNFGILGCFTPDGIWTKTGAYHPDGTYKEIGESVPVMAAVKPSQEENNGKFDLRGRYWKSGIQESLTLRDCWKAVEKGKGAFGPDGNYYPHGRYLEYGRFLPK